jgi:hypothetical protein
MGQIHCPPVQPWDNWPLDWCLAENRCKAIFLVLVLVLLLETNCKIEDEDEDENEED